MISTLSASIAKKDDDHITFCNNSMPLFVKPYHKYNEIKRQINQSNNKNLKFTWQ